MTIQRGRGIGLVLVIAGILHITFPGEAKAYLDPGSVSLFFQALVAGVLGGLFLLKRFWTQIKTSVKSLFSGQSGNDDT